ncbi:hypothetical protein DFH29DRAFT_951749 [Suillus ampliporus]|nr:hypothetical protein DFH29DRAFT_951749 [Suillus ampliporus]
MSGGTDSEIPMSSVTAATLHSALHHFETAWLFTRSDFKTIILPVMVFATVVSPHHNPLALSYSLCWLWFHLFQFNVSNQSYSAHEDVVNKPWRPLPSGRISVKDSRVLRWGLVFSAWEAMQPLKLGSTLIMSGGSSLDGTSITALSCSALVILVTIHAQDFADVNGDRRLGRRTLPIVAPEGSRIYMLCVLPLLSFALVSFWSLGPLCSILFVSMGSWVGLRYFFFRGEICDQSNYWLYNVWLMSAHILPANVRFRVLSW